MAVLIDKPILELLNITEKTNLKISTDGSRIILEPVRGSQKIPKVSDEKQVQKIYEEIIKKYGKSFEKLAKEHDEN